MASVLEDGKTHVTVCTECGADAVRCGDHWHHAQVPTVAHFPSV